MSQYRFKHSFSHEANLSHQLFELLEVVFPGITHEAQQLKKLGVSWETASTPFIRFQEDKAVTHVGVLEIPMQIMHNRVTVGGIHAVATHPEFRRRGYYREVMTEILQYCDQRYETLLLTTSNPEFYTSFGFSILPEYLFKIKCISTNTKNSLRVLNLSEQQDLQLLHRLLEAKIPISNIVGVFHEKPLFCFNECRHSLYYAEDLDLIICMTLENQQLHLFDLVTKQIYPLQEILARIPQKITEVLIYFSPDRLDVRDSEAIPYFFDDGVLMVRGAFAAKSQKFMLPRSARC